MMSRRPSNYRVAAAGKSDKNVVRSMPADKNVRLTDRHAREARRLSTLLDVSQALSGTLNLKASLHGVLEILTAEHGAMRGMVSLLHPDGDLRVEASDGLGDPSRVVRYQLGEGIIGKVAQSGK